MILGGGKKGGTPGDINGGGNGGRMGTGIGGSVNFCYIQLVFFAKTLLKPKKQKTIG